MFGAEVERTVIHGHRTTPPELVELLCSLPEWGDRPGMTVDLGCGDGGLCRVIEEIEPGNPWVLIDKRSEAVAAMAGWEPEGGLIINMFDAADEMEWPGLGYSDATRVVSNPPWCIDTCKNSHGHPSTTRTRCKICKEPLADLAITMVTQSMSRCPNADHWILHNVDWPFHEQRARFFDLTNEFRFAGQDHASWRVAFGDPAQRDAVKPYNKQAVWYHFVPASRYQGQHIRYHQRPDRWPR